MSRAFSFETGEKSVSKLLEVCPAPEWTSGRVGADNARGMELVPLPQQRGEVLVEVIGGVRKGGEDQNLLVARD